MSKRFAIAIGVAAAGVMALGAQTTAAAPDVVKYDTVLTITHDRSNLWHGKVKSQVRKCRRGRSVTLFKQRPGTDAKLGKDTRTPGAPSVWEAGEWVVKLQQLPQDGWRMYAKVTPKERGQFVCRADRSEIYTWGSGG